MSRVEYVVVKDCWFLSRAQTRTRMATWAAWEHECKHFKSWKEAEAVAARHPGATARESRVAFGEWWKT